MRYRFSLCIQQISRIQTSNLTNTEHDAASKFIQFSKKRVIDFSQFVLLFILFKYYFLFALLGVVLSTHKLMKFACKGLLFLLGYLCNLWVFIDLLELVIEMFVFIKFGIIFYDELWLIWRRYIQSFSTFLFHTLHHLILWCITLNLLFFIRLHLPSRFLILS